MSNDANDRRYWTRLDKVFSVLVESPQFGFMHCVARNISAGGVFLETREPLPLGSHLRVYFALPQGENAITAHGQVKNHYYFTYGSEQGPTCLTGMGVRFTEFEDNGQQRLHDTLRQCVQ